MFAAFKLLRTLAVARYVRYGHTHNKHEDVISLQKTVRRYAMDILRPLAGKLDEERLYPTRQIAELGKVGILAIGVSEDYGGCGLGSVAISAVVEELSMGCASTGAIVSIHNCLYANLLDKFGTVEQKAEYLAPFTSGRIGCFALSEPDAGSDVAAIRTTAIPENGGFLLTGTKSWVTSGTVGDAAIVFATIDSRLRHKGITAFILPLDSPGITICEPEETLGIRAAHCCDILLDNVEVDASNILGEHGEGFGIAMEQLELARIGIAAQALGIGQAALDAAVAYALNRIAFQKPLAEFQAVKLRIAEMALRLESARFLLYHAAETYDSGENVAKESSMAKAAASTAATLIAHNAVQIYGAHGYVLGSSVERHFRDARVTEIYGGVTDIQKCIIADAVFDEYMDRHDL